MWKWSAAVITLMLAACTSPASPPGHSAETGLTPAASPSHQTEQGLAVDGCPRAVEAIDDGVHSAVASGDVDGDGSAEPVRVAVDARARPGCRAFVVVGDSGRALVAAIEDDLISFNLGLPRISRLVDIDPGPGEEIVLDVAAGASTAFVGVFTVEDGAIERVRARGVPGTRELFAYGGSVSHLDGVDCRAGMVMVSSATAHRRGYRLTRRWLEPTGAVWKAQPSLTQHRSVPFEEIGRFEELSAPPFSSCHTRGGLQRKVQLPLEVTPSP